MKWKGRYRKRRRGRKGARKQIIHFIFDRLEEIIS